MSSVLVVNHKPLSESMTGPAIRNWELSKTLAHENDVTLAVPGATDRSHPSFRVVAYDARSLPALVRDADVVVGSGYLMDRHPCLLQARHLVVDLYDPFPLENLHMNTAADIDEQYRIAAYDRAVLTRLVRAGDVFLCASDRQRDFWSGWLAAVGRVNPYTHDADPSLSSLLLTVPFGVSEKPPTPGPPMFRGVVSGIADSDYLVLWGGGIWNWFDPLTLIRAAARLAPDHPQLRVLFPARASAGEQLPPMRMAQTAQSLSDSLGLTDRVVFFGKTWVPYDQRGPMLLEADLGVSLHLDDVETRFSFRTRVLDYLWAGLPILTTQGDAMAELVDAEDLGAVVPYGDDAAVAEAIGVLISNPDRSRACASRSAAVAKRYHWSVVAASLLDYCRAPYQAADRARLRKESPVHAWTGNQSLDREARRLLKRSWQTLRSDGLAQLVSRGVGYVRRPKST
jgi:glycosyltransferase involved in cell wall biosynthesis